MSEHDWFKQNPRLLCRKETSDRSSTRSGTIEHSKFTVLVGEERLSLYPPRFDNWVYEIN